MVRRMNFVFTNYHLRGLIFGRVVQQPVTQAGSAARIRKLFVLQIVPIIIGRRL